MKNATPDLAAAEIVALAKARTPWILANRWRVMGHADAYVLRGGEAGVCRPDDPLAGLDVLMRAPLNAKEPAALVRALVASTIATMWHDLSDDHSAWLGPCFGNGPAARAKTVQGARDALLDLLLPPPKSDGGPFADHPS